ncbi:MAG: hypothetical protein ACKV2O_02710 [Acidimicrobiales bacterium]
MPGRRWSRRRFLAAAAGIPIGIAGGLQAGADTTATPGPSPGATRTRVFRPRRPTVASPDSARRADFTIDAYRGLGAWVDVFDWSLAYTGGAPRIGEAEVAALAGRGVRTVFLQTARYDRPEAADDLLEVDRQRAIATAAQRAGMAVVGWYLPMHLDANHDTRRALAALRAPWLNGLALDIESRAEPDPGLRNARLDQLVAEVRAAAGPRAALGAIVVPPTTMQDVNAQFWPGFDWAMLAARLNVFLPMNYWTNRLADSPWRQAGPSCAENIARLRAHAGRADYPVHMVGGIADLVSAAEVAAMVGAVQAAGALGASLYDLATTTEDLWAPLGQSLEG